MLVVVCGPPGTGKTTVSEWLADRFDACLLRTDVVRTDVVEDPVYTEAERERVYEELFERIAERLESGETVVADGTFDRRPYRERVRELGRRAGAAVELVRVTCDPETVKPRIRDRDGDASEATVENYCEIRDGFDPVDAAHLRLDNSGPWAATERQLREHFEVERDGS